MQSVAHLVVVGLFRLNREYIAKNLCENRKAPEKKCCGKCYLRKQLKKVNDTDEGSSNGSTLKIEKTEVVCLIPEGVKFCPVFESVSRNVLNPLSRDLVPMDVPMSIFHPPSVAC